MIEDRPGLPDVVTFSNGPQGSRSKLWSRVCQYVTDPERRRLCINQDSDGRGAEQPGDAFPMHHHRSGQQLTAGRRSRTLKVCPTGISLREIGHN